jgi:hypothetical protein
MPKNKVRFANFFLFESICDACGESVTVSAAKVGGGGAWAFWFASSDGSLVVRWFWFKF